MKTHKPTPNEDKTEKHFFLALICLFAVSFASAAWCEETWKTSFDDICSKVDASGAMNTRELSALVERLDKLAPEIQASSDPTKKIYLQRLKKCRAMYVFMIDIKKDSGK